MPENFDSRTFNRKNRRKRALSSLTRFSRYWYIRLVRLQGHPIEIARGLAVGVFSGFFPWMGLQIVIAIFLAIVVRGNKIAAAAATWISNPFTSIPIFIFNYKVGEFILGQQNQAINRDYFQPNGVLTNNWASLGSEVLFILFFGSLVMGTIGGIITYFVSYRLLQRRYSRRQLRAKRSR